MKRLIFFALMGVALLLSGCDIPSAEFEEKVYTVVSHGQVITIPVLTTGVDEIEIRSSEGGEFQEIVWTTDDGYELDVRRNAEWIELVDFIDSYPATRALAEWRSGIKLQIAPNTSSKARHAIIQVCSFGAHAKVKIKQEGK